MPQNDHTPQPRRARRVLALLLTASLGLSLSACGGDVTKDGRSASATKPHATDKPATAKTGAKADMKPTEPGWRDGEFNTESYDRIFDNPFLQAAQDPLSTFSIDVDTASYSNVRRFLNEGRLPPKDAVRIEELVNYFTYDYPEPRGEHPVSVTADLARCPWNDKHLLVRIGLRARSIHREQLPPRNFVFLIDTSGSMQSEDKLPLLKSSLKLLAETLTPQDRVAIVAYAGSAGLVLDSTPGNNRQAILGAIGRLESGGSTHGSAGIQLAYGVAQRNFIKGGLNRVILGTDGDFNVGVTDQGALIRLIEKKRAAGVFLSLLGFGRGNLQDSTMEKLAHHGNGHYAYVDSLAEARKLFLEQGGALVPAAKDVKLQVEFNPRRVGAYRLVGYENRLLRDQDFNDDQKDAGDMGAGHTVTALYEVVPAGQPINVPGVDPLKYQTERQPAEAAASGEWLMVKMRYKEPDGERSKLLSHPLKGEPAAFDAAPEGFRFAAAVAAFGLVLRDSKYKGTADLGRVADWAKRSLGRDLQGHRAEFLRLVEAAASQMQRD